MPQARSDAPSQLPYKSLACPKYSCATGCRKMPLQRLEPCGSNDPCMVLRGLDARDRAQLPDRTNIASKRSIMFSLTGKADNILHGLALDDSQILPSRVCVASRIRLSSSGARPDRKRQSRLLNPRGSSPQSLKALPVRRAFLCPGRIGVG